MNNTIKLSLLTTLLINTLTASENLEEITVISATKTSQKLEDVTSNINVITAQEIEERHYTTVTEALNSLPGINFTSTGGLGTSTSIRVRGMASKRVLVLIDGIRYNDITGLSGASFEHLMINDIERIEVLKGAQSGIWGADAAAGVINIITKNANEGVSIYASEEFGSFDSSKLNLGASYKTDDFHIKANHTRTDTRGFSAQLPKGAKLEDLEDDAYNNKTSNLQAEFSINANNKIEISYTSIDATSNYDGYKDENSSDYATTNNTFSSISFNHVDSFNTFDIYAKKSIFDREFISSYGKSPYEGEVNEYGANSKIPYLKDSFVVVGGDYKKFEHKNEIDERFTNKGFFLTNSNKFAGGLGGTTILTQSIRHDIYSDFDNKTTGKIGLKHIHSNIEGFSTSINYGTAYNIPTLNNLYSPQYGNRDISPEETKSWDVTAAYKEIKVTYFNTEVKDMIDYYDPDGYTGELPGSYNNISGTSKIDGVEVGYQNNIGKDILFSSSYTYTNAKNNDKQTLRRVPKENIKVALDYYGIEKLHLGLIGEYVGERYSMDDKEGVQTGNYSTANFTTNYEIDKHMSLYGKVANFTNKEYQTVDGYATSPRAVYLGMKLTY